MAPLGAVSRALRSRSVRRGKYQSPIGITPFSEPRHAAPRVMAPLASRRMRDRVGSPLAPGVRVAPGGRSAGLAAHGLVERRALPRVARGPRGGGRRRVVAHEALERGDDRGGLLRRRGGRDDLALGAAVHAAEGIVPPPCPRSPSSTTTPSSPRCPPQTRSTP